MYNNYQKCLDNHIIQIKMWKIVKQCISCNQEFNLNQEPKGVPALRISKQSMKNPIKMQKHNKISITQELCKKQKSSQNCQYLETSLCIQQKLNKQSKITKQSTNTNIDEKYFNSSLKLYQTTSISSMPNTHKINHRRLCSSNQLYKGYYQNSKSKIIKKEDAQTKKQSPLLSTCVGSYPIIKISFKQIDKKINIYSEKFDKYQLDSKQDNPEENTPSIQTKREFMATSSQTSLSELQINPIANIPVLKEIKIQEGDYYILNLKHKAIQSQNDGLDSEIFSEVQGYGISIDDIRLEQLSNTRQRLLDYFSSNYKQSNLLDSNLTFAHTKA